METNDFERDAVESVQGYLRHLTFHDEGLGAQGSVPVDGIWGSATRDALVKFQKSRGLPVTGTVDRNTWELLRSEYEASVAENSPPAALDIFPRYPLGFSIKLGDRGFLVDTVQYLIEQLERLYHFPDFVASGVYDEQTEAYVRDFQRRNRIPSTGEVNRETWDAMAVQHNLLLEHEE